LRAKKVGVAENNIALSAALRHINIRLDGDGSPAKSANGVWYRNDMSDVVEKQANYLPIWRKKKYQHIAGAASTAAARCGLWEDSGQQQRLCI